MVAIILLAMVSIGEAAPQPINDEQAEQAVDGDDILQSTYGERVKIAKRAAGCHKGNWGDCHLWANDELRAKLCG